MRSKTITVFNVKYRRSGDDYEVLHSARLTKRRHLPRGSYKASYGTQNGKHP